MILDVGSLILFAWFLQFLFACFLFLSAWFLFICVFSFFSSAWFLFYLRIFFFVCVVSFCGVSLVGHRLTITYVKVK